MDFQDNYSRGCKACQKGKWLCIFLTYLCNASCSFCPAPVKNKDIIQSAFGDNPEVILKYLNQYPFEGLSFSGGESFLVYDRMLTWLDFFKSNKPELYYWAYTNGIKLSRKQMVGLSKAGLNELRFNIAASDYCNPSVLKVISYATDVFEHVVIEIPSIPEDFDRLIKILPTIDKMGIDYLNLHEYILVPNDPNTKLAPSAHFLMNFEMKLKYHLASLPNTEKIKSFCMENSLNIKVNNCSLQKKEYQMVGRRKTMGTLLKEDYEKLSEDGLLETVYIPKANHINLLESLKNYHKIDRTNFIHPDKYSQGRSDAFLLKILPKISIDTPSKVIKFSKI